MKKSLKWLCAAIAGLLVASQGAQAAQKSYSFIYSTALELQNGAYIDLKGQFKKAYPKVSLDGAQLLAVHVDLKAYDGHGDVQMRVGQFFSQRFLIPGNPWNWDRPDAYGRFSVSRFPEWEMNGPWHLIFRNNYFRVKRVVLVLESLDPEPIPEPEPIPQPEPQPEDRDQGETEPQPEPNFSSAFTPVSLLTSSARPTPAPPDFKEVECASQNGRSEFCWVGAPVQYAFVVRSTDGSSCRENIDYTVSGDGIWVRNGCQARFGVYVRPYILNR